MKRRTIRFRFTLLYTTLFVIMSLVLVATVNLVFTRSLDVRVAAISRPAPAPELLPLPPNVIKGVGQLPDDVRDEQWAVSLVAILVLTVLAILASWWLAGRMLRPLRRITTTARRLSLSNLHERIALAGPNDELKDLADTFDAMLARLERSVDSQRQFIANAAHELRTPLATQRAAIQIGLEDAENLPEVRAKLLTHNRRTERLIDSLLVLAHAENGLETTQPVDLAALARQTAAELKPDGIAVTVDVQPLVIPGDAVLLHLLLVNLFHNAIRYNTPDGSVHIELTPAGVLSVRNTGPQVPPDRIPELFQPFRRLHTRTRTDGSGLGLSIVASIAEAHDATVAAQPNPEGGLTLTVKFLARTRQTAARG